MKKGKLLVGAALLLTVIFLLGCSLLAVEPVLAEPTELPPPTNTSVPADIAIPTDTPMPTNTLMATDTPAPTSTPDPSVCGVLGAKLLDTFGARALTIQKDLVIADKCQIGTTFTGLENTDFMTLFNATSGMMQLQGWVEDQTYQADGPGGTGTGFRKQGELCKLSVTSKSIDPGLCSSNEPFASCWERLTNNQKLFELIIDCAPESGNVDVPIEDGLVRIQFAPGSIFAQETGTLPAFGRSHYVLRAAANQVMTVNLRITSGAGALLIIWGEDGSVFVTDHATTTYWQGKLPLMQDYYITVVASPDGSVNYTLEVTIPPL